MFCPMCGNEVKTSAKFCSNCGSILQGTESKTDEVSSLVIDPMQEQPEDERQSSFDPDADNEQDLEFEYKVGDFMYAKCAFVQGKGYFFYGIDGVSRSFFPYNFVFGNLKPEDMDGQYFWLKIEERLNMEHTYKCKKLTAASPSNQQLLMEQFASFSSNHAKGEIVHLPITGAEKGMIKTQIGPTALSSTKITAEGKKIDTSSVNKPWGKFVITRNECIDSKYILEFAYIEEFDEKDKKLWELLPKAGKDLIIPAKVFECTSQSLRTKMKADNPKQYREYIAEKYEEKLKLKRINVQKRQDCYYMDFMLDIKDERGVPQSAGFRMRPGNKWFMNLVGFASAERIFESYVYINDWDGLLEDLKDRSLRGEEWDYAGQKNYILKQYLLFNFYKAWLDEIIAENDKGEAVFNTGLVDSSYDEIYCYLTPNTHHDFYERKWQFEYFACRGKRAEGKELNSKFAEFPKAPSYIDIEKIENIYYDPNKELSCDYEHIIRENAKRLPLSFIKARTWDEEFKEIVTEYEKTGRKEARDKIYQFISEDSDDETENRRRVELRRSLQRGLEEAVDTATKYCKWNYKTAVPIYYPRKNAISLLLPLKLRDGADTTADVALVVERLPHGNYQGQTILTMRMAYQDARQICRPNSEWLTLKEKDPEDEFDKI